MQASRVCESCSFKESSTRAYCDVCFFNHHPGLDDLSKAEAATTGVGGEAGAGGGAGGEAKAWTLSLAGKQHGWDHRRVKSDELDSMSDYC